jgi:hypothetical protein
VITRLISIYADFVSSQCDSFISIAVNRPRLLQFFDSFSSKGRHHYYRDVHTETFKAQHNYSSKTSGKKFLPSSFNTLLANWQNFTLGFEHSALCDRLLALESGLRGIEFQSLYFGGGTYYADEIEEYHQNIISTKALIDVIGCKLIPPPKRVTS